MNCIDFYSQYLKEDIIAKLIGESPHIKLQGDKVFIPIGKSKKYSTKDVAYGMAQSKVKALNKTYGKFGSVVSIDSTPSNGVYINVHVPLKLTHYFNYRNRPEQYNNAPTQKEIDYLEMESQQAEDAARAGEDFTTGYLFEPYSYEFDDIFNQNTIVPEFEQVLAYKNKLIRSNEQRLKELKIQKKRAGQDINELRRITALEHELDIRLNGSESAGIDGLYSEVDILTKSDTIDKLMYYAGKEVDRLEKLIASPITEDLNEARTIISFYTSLGTFDSNKDHPLFSKSDMFDDDGNLILPDDLVDELQGLKDVVIESQNKLQSSEKKNLTATINTSTSVKTTLGEVSYEQAFAPKKDINWVDMFLMDITNGIFSDNGIIPQVMMETLKNSIEESLVGAKDIETRVNGITLGVEKLLSKDYPLSFPFKKGASYEIFMAKDKNGNYRDSITQRYSSEFFTSRKNALAKFYETLKEAKYENSQSKSTVAYSERNNWYKKNTILLDIRKLSEIYDVEGAEKLKEEHFNQAESEAYTKELKDILGDQGYEEEISKQKKMISNYLNMRTTVEENLYADKDESNVQKSLDLWDKKNNPFTTVKDYYDGKVTYSQMNYNYAVPRKKTAMLKVEDGKLNVYETEGDTGYYDKNFEKIESEPQLKEFHNILMELNDQITLLPKDIQDRFNAFSLPALRKNISEIISDPNMPFLMKLSKVLRELRDKIKGMFGETIQDNFSYAEIDPITGKPQYQVSSSFIKGNKSEINQRVYLERLRVEQLIGKLNKFTKVDISKSQGVIDILAENLGVPNTLAALKARLPETSMTEMDVNEVLKSAVTHQVISEQSFDFPKIIKMYSYMLAEYQARQKVLPQLELMKRHYDQIAKVVADKNGDDVISSTSDSSLLEKERKHATFQMESWFNRAVLGNYESKDEIGDTRLKKKIFKLNPDEEKESFLGKMSTVANAKFSATLPGRILSTDEKIMYDKISELRKGASESEMEALNKIEDKLGKQMSMKSFTDAIFNFIRFKGLGWNLSSYLTNFMEGQIANTIAASSGIYFKPENIFRANDIVKWSFVKSASVGKIQHKNAKLISVLMERYRILQDASNEMQKASAKSSVDKFKNLSPYEGTKRTEYLNQAPIMLSMLFDQEIIGIDGKKSSVWDAMNEEGQLLENFDTEENRKNWVDADGDIYNTFKVKTEKAIVNIHGDYDQYRGMAATEYMTGKAFTMFKRWISRNFYQRFATPQTDLELGQAEFKGRFRSHTAASAALHGSLIGLAGAGMFGIGLPGLAIGGAVGLIAGKHFGANTSMGFLEEMAFTVKETAMNLLRIPVNNLLGKEALKGTDIEKLRDAGMSEVDYNNFRANLTDMSILLGNIGLLFFVKALFSSLKGDDDEENKKLQEKENFFANKFMQLASQSTMYLNPVESYNNTIGSIAIVNFADDVRKTLASVGDIFSNNDIIPSGVNSGESKFYNQFQKTFYPGIMKGSFGFEAQMQRQFNKSPFDNTFSPREDAARSELSKIRAAKRRIYRNAGLTKKEINTKMRKYHKPPKVSYEDFLNKISK